MSWRRATLRAESSSGSWSRGVSRVFRSGTGCARGGAGGESLLSLLRWWLNRGEKESPQAMDELFCQTVRRG